MNKCNTCTRTEADGAKFHRLAATGDLDSMCQACRFDLIDAKHSSISEIRDDMEAAGIPLRTYRERK